ncbi:MAG: hypothetical protein Kow0068_19060 [Marinilabiliales bacterium]
MTNEAYEYFGCNSGDVFFIGVNEDTDDAGAIAWDNTNGVNYTTISSVNGGSNIFSIYNPAALPTLILIAPDHSIVEQDIWPISSSATIINLFESYGMTQQSCSTGKISYSKKKSELSVYPNPANDKLFIDGANPETVSIFNVLGKELIKTDNFIGSIDISNLHEGIYILKIKIDNITESRKFIIER